METSLLKGKWAWEVKGKLSSRIIEFVPEGDTIMVRVTDGDNIKEIKNLEINRSNDEGIVSYLFCNSWFSKGSNSFFSMELQFVEKDKPGTFINISEFNIINSTTIKQIHQGYSFDNKNEKWVPFIKEYILKKL